jgi:enediyne biosynthesis protein E4
MKFSFFCPGTSRSITISNRSLGQARNWLSIDAKVGLLLLIMALGSAGCQGNTLPQLANEQAALFRDVTLSSGIDHTYRNGEANNLAILESLGGGVALLDFDGDGLLDVFVTGGGFFQGREIRGYPCKLYRNMGGCKFEDVSTRLVLDGPWFYTHGCAVADFDRDGWPDLLVTGWGRVALFHNEAIDPANPARGRRLVDVSTRVGLAAPSWNTSAAWADFDGDGYPDLYVARYVDWSFANHPKCSYEGKIPDVCAPKSFSGLTHALYRNHKGRTFTDVSHEAGLHPGGPQASKGLGVLAVDVNGDGKPDIYVANDTVDRFLYINRCSPGRFRFEELGLPSGAARDDRGIATGSMGLDVADYDVSGRPSLWVTNYELEMHGLYHNECRPDRVLFRYDSGRAGISRMGSTYVGWGTGFLDVANRGWEDLFIAHGHAIRYPAIGHRAQKPVLLRNDGGRFQDISAQSGPYFEQEHQGRGVALGDLDNDGRIDVVISHLNEPVVVLHNEAGTGNHWLGVQLVGKNHADVVGARVSLEAAGRKQTRFAKGGGSYASSGDRRLVFGLGEAESVDRLKVVWPSGQEQYWDGLPIDRYHQLVQASCVER